MARTRWLEIGIVLAALGLGTLVYVFDRPPGFTALPAHVTLFQPTIAVFGSLGQMLPAFVHVFAFSLLTIALIDGGRRAAVLVCSGWFLMDSAFELGQYPPVGTALARFVPSWFEHLPILERTEGFFRYGTFDPLDLLSVAAGALAAYALIECRELRRASPK